MQIKATIRDHLTPVRMAIIKKSTNNQCWWGDGEKGTLEYCWWECKLVQPLWKTAWRCLRKLKIELLYDPAILLLGIYLDKMKTQIWNDTWTPMFTGALFTIAKIQKQPKCPSTDEWIKKIWYIQYDGILPSHKKKNEIVPFATTWMDIECIMLCEISQSEEDKHHMLSLICGTWKIKQMNVYNKKETDSQI